jgi:hypothetical protein
MKSLYTLLALSVGCFSLCFLSSTYGNVPGEKEVAELLIGTWVHKQNGDMNSFRYVKTDALEKNNRGFIFSDSGKVTIYGEFGCQMPFPSFKMNYGSWNVKSKNSILIDRNYPGETPDRMKIIKLTNRTLRFIWK